MVTRKEYNKKTKAFWIGKRVRLTEELRSGIHVFPKGLIMKIEDKHGGFTLKAERRCEYCGVGDRLGISKVDPEEVEILEEQDKHSELENAKCS